MSDYKVSCKPPQVDGHCTWEVTTPSGKKSSLTSKKQLIDNKIRTAKQLEAMERQGQMRAVRAALSKGRKQYLRKSEKECTLDNKKIECIIDKDGNCQLYCYGKPTTAKKLLAMAGDDKNRQRGIKVAIAAAKKRAMKKLVRRGAAIIQGRKPSKKGKTGFSKLNVYLKFVEAANALQLAEDMPVAERGKALGAAYRQATEQNPDLKDALKDLTSASAAAQLLKKYDVKIAGEAAKAATIVPAKSEDSIPAPAAVPAKVKKAKQPAVAVATVAPVKVKKAKKAAAVPEAPSMGKKTTAQQLIQVIKDANTDINDPEKPKGKASRMLDAYIAEVLLQYMRQVAPSKDLPWAAIVEDMSDMIIENLEQEEDNFDYSDDSSKKLLCLENTELAKNAAARRSCFWGILRMQSDDTRDKIAEEFEKVFKDAGFEPPKYANFLAAVMDVQQCPGKWDDDSSKMVKDAQESILSEAQALYNRKKDDLSAEDILKLTQLYIQMIGLRKLACEFRAGKTVITTAQGEAKQEPLRSVLRGPGMFAGLIGQGNRALHFAREFQKKVTELGLFEKESNTVLESFDGDVDTLMGVLASSKKQEAVGKKLFDQLPTFRSAWSQVMQAQLQSGKVWLGSTSA